MIRALFVAQFAYFLGFGIVAGMAFTFYLEHATAAAKTMAAVKILVDMPIHSLGDLSI